MTIPSSGTIHITGLRVRAVNVPLEYPVKTAVGLVATSPLVLIDLETDGGITGRAYLFAYLPAVLKPLAQTVRELAALVQGEPLAPVALAGLLDQRLRLIGNTGLLKMATAGIDMAAWDALAKSCGVPLVTLLGGTPRPIRAYDSHAMDGLPLAVERAARAAEAGFGGVKTKIGYATLEEDIAVVRAIGAATDGRLAIMVDYNQSLTVPEAIRRARALADEGVHWIEEPTLQQDYAGHAAIRAATTVPVQMGENWFGTDEMTKALDAGACSLGMADIMKIGGVTGWLAAASLAQQRGLPLSSHLFQEFSAHVLAVTPTADWLERLDIAGPILEPQLQFIDGHAVIGDAPGAGILWREKAIAAYQVN